MISSFHTKITNLDILFKNLTLICCHNGGLMSFTARVKQAIRWDHDCHIFLDGYVSNAILPSLPGYHHTSLRGCTARMEMHLSQSTMPWCCLYWYSASGHHRLMKASFSYSGRNVEINLCYTIMRLLRSLMRAILHGRILTRFLYNEGWGFPYRFLAFLILHLVTYPSVPMSHLQIYKNNCLFRRKIRKQSQELLTFHM